MLSPQPCWLVQSAGTRFRRCFLQQKLMHSVRAERRLGELMAEGPRAKGGAWLQSNTGRIFALLRLIGLPLATMRSSVDTVN
jgi:hypothetical protein